MGGDGGRGLWRLRTRNVRYESDMRRLKVSSAEVSQGTEHSVHRRRERRGVTRNIRFPVGSVAEADVAEGGWAAAGTEI
jgi:hypothetical protein